MGKKPKKKSQDFLEECTQDELELRKEKEEDKSRRQRKILTHNFRLKDIKPLTENQESVFHSYFSGQNVLMYGCAGSGKSFISLYLALNDLIAGKYKKIIIVRSAVASREVGFLPGTLAEKLAFYELPYQDMVSDLAQLPGAYDWLKSKDMLEFLSTSFVRGITLDDCIIIIDEAQNMLLHELSSILTRVGKNTKVFICGDTRQNDLAHAKGKQESGLPQMVNIAKHMKSFGVVEFQVKDIVRSGFVYDFLLAKINLGYD